MSNSIERSHWQGTLAADSRFVSAGMFCIASAHCNKWRERTAQCGAFCRDCIKSLAEGRDPACVKGNVAATTAAARRMLGTEHPSGVFALGFVADDRERDVEICGSRC